MCKFVHQLLSFLTLFIVGALEVSNTLQGSLPSALFGLTSLTDIKLGTCQRHV